MSNAALCLNSLPAERMRGVQFAQRFWDNASVLRDAWTLFGAPGVDKGLWLNGTTQYATRELHGELNHDELTIEIEFYPDFAHDDGVFTTFFQAVTGIGVCYLQKRNTDWLEFAYGAAGGLNIRSAPGVYGAYWLVGQRNLLTITAESGAQDMYLNGHLIASDIDVYANSSLTLLYVGCLLGPARFFDGIISDFRIGHYLATQQEHIDRWNHATWDWRNLLTYDLEFSTGAYDPVNHRTYDARTETLYAVLGNGAGVGEPTQAVGHMVFDGANDYLSGIANPVGLFTVMGLEDTGTGWTFFSTNDLTHWTPIFTSGGFAGNLSALMLAPSVLTPTQELDAEIQIFRSLGHQL